MERMIEWAVLATKKIATEHALRMHHIADRASICDVKVVTLTLLAYVHRLDFIEFKGTFAPVTGRTTPNM